MGNHKKKSLSIIGIEEKEESQVSGIEQIFSKIIEEKLSKPREREITEALRASKTEDEKRKYLWHIIAKTLSIYNKESILKDTRGKKKPQITYKEKPTRITADFY